MGAAHGHIAHLYEVDFTFREIQTILGDIAKNKIPAFEKIDGQNLMISYVDNNIVAARNKTQLKNPVGIEYIPELQFSKYPHVMETFENAILNIQKAFEAIAPTSLNKYFRNGKRFLSIEIYNKKSANVIHYDESMIVLNNFFDVDQNGNITNPDPYAAMDFHMTYDIHFKNNDIYPPESLLGFQYDPNEFIEVCKSHGITDINIPLSQYPLDIVKGCITHLTTLLLSTCKSKTNKELTNNYIKQGIVDVLNQAKQNPILQGKIMPHMKILNKIPGYQKIVTGEGVVFYYKGMTFKLTGAFAPINQILGILKYSR